MAMLDFIALRLINRNLIIEKHEYPVKKVIVQIFRNLPALGRCADSGHSQARALVAQRPQAEIIRDT